MTENATVRRDAGRRPRVLVVDDDSDVLDSLVELLHRDYEVIATTDPAEAMIILHADRELALVLADQRMPDKTGVELLAEAAQLRPDAARMLFTGYSDISAVIAAINDGRVYRYITKPWNPDELLANVAAAVRIHGITRENSRLTSELRRALSEAQGEKDRVEHREPEESDAAHRNEILASALEDLRESHWHLRRIQELLPICSYCGKVRTEDTYWQSVEDYLRKNSDFLTHSVCPECLAELEKELDMGLEGDDESDEP
jgi:response regulator RpfG family c-di-GMP phosphodiesterase